MKVSIERQDCISCGLCVSTCPEVFQFGDDGRSQVRCQPGPELEDAPALLAAENGTVGNAVIYYAFDNGVNSNRYPYYSYMKDYWNGFGLDTHLDMMVTVSDLKRMADYDLAILSAHGAYYTYENGTIVLSETCEFYGRSGHVDTALSNGLLSGGAAAVAGFVNNVYSVYSRSMLWATVNRLIEGETLQQAIDYGLEVYGENDIVWYLNQNTGRRPHPAASYPIIQGDGTARLTAPGTATNSAAEQQTPAAA